MVTLRYFNSHAVTCNAGTCSHSLPAPGALSSLIRLGKVLYGAQQVCPFGPRTELRFTQHATLSVFYGAERLGQDARNSS
ncbi:hypothetical protein RRG08_031472 [Elysia crispata]|uniref:Uncharacterized protein n=1 Tax=Elysia crispata TaxID=231223 RepID=A0AAE1DK82_9GAST|nr:hypothetical protein RRG08_031472 [Elysia crispata]